MKKKLLLIVLTFLIWTVIFTLQKPFFLIFYGGFSQVFNVVRHGLKLDLSTGCLLDSHTIYYPINQFNTHQMLIWR